MGKTIGITYDLKSDWEVKAGDPKDINAEFDAPETLEKIIAALEWGGHQVKGIGNAYSLLKQIKNLDVDIVFNICEGYTGRNRESEVPILLEMFKIPYVGADALTLGVTLDKITTKKCFISDGIPTPRFFEAKNTQNLEAQNMIGYPLIVKCRYEGTSKGLTTASRVSDLQSLKKQVEVINHTYNQPAIVEEFIKGTEFTVAVLGNENPQAMPVTQICINNCNELGNEFYTFERVLNEEVTYVCPSPVSNEMKAQLQELAIRAYQSVECRDFGRVDFRVDENGHPYVLEINPLPSLANNDIFTVFPQTMGSTYEKIINQIVEYALLRQGMSDHTSQELIGTR